ncbi:MAG: transcription elongation factor GreA [Oscillospiraceae bacterium]|nr:transcription elongation factor GreA [Oscillospiraceae bacterium]
MVKQLVVSAEGLKRLEAELEELKTVGRQEIAEKIKEARSFGDLSENSEYDEAKNEQAILEAKIAELERQLKNVKILDDAEIDHTKVSIGSKVTAVNENTGKEVTYTIVGSTEADPFKGKISDESPVGAALLGHGVGETVEAELPNGATVQYTITGIGR